MSSASPTVFIVDEENAVRSALANVLRAYGHRVETFPSAENFFGAVSEEEPGCLLIEFQMGGPGHNNRESRLLLSPHVRPTVFMTAFATLRDGVEAMKRGAVDFLLKPIQQRHLLPAIELALAVDRLERQKMILARNACDLTSRLTPREREVLNHVVRGLMNKQIAALLGTTEKTIKVHRARVLQKTGTRSVAQLVRLVGHIEGLAPTHAMQSFDRSRAAHRCGLYF